MSDPNKRCKHRIYRYGYRGQLLLDQCTRDATDTDGLCNVCRSAIRRGERQRDAAAARRDAHNAEVDAAVDSLAQLPAAAEARLHFNSSGFSYDPDRVEVSREWLLAIVRNTQLGKKDD